MERQRSFKSEDLNFTKFRKLSEDIVSANIFDSLTGRHLIAAFMNRKAVDLTLETGEVYFWSRKEKKLWHKGATSGNKLKVNRIEVDCDCDSLDIYVTPAGPACHFGAISCFDVGPEMNFEESSQK